MRTLRILLFVGLAGFIGVVVWDLAYQSRLVSPTSENESAFLKSYSPNAVLEKFKTTPAAQMESGVSAGAELGFGEILQESGNATDGFKMTYADGNARGTIDIDPVKDAPAVRPGGSNSGDGRVTVSFRVRIQEKWFKPRSHPISNQG